MSSVMPKSACLPAVRALLGLTLVGLSFEACGSSETAAPTCGPGTTLSNGQCVVAAECGPGTVLKAGKCIPENTGGNGGGSPGEAGKGGYPSGGQGGMTPTAGKAGAGGAGAGGSSPGGQGGNGGLSSAGQGGSSEGGAAGQGGTSQSGSGQGGEPAAGQAGAGQAGAEQAGQAGAGLAGSGQAGSAGQAGGAGQTGVAGSGGSGGTSGGNPNEDDPCPDTTNAYFVNCSDTCGPKHPDCDKYPCNSDSTTEVVPPAFFTRIILRTPNSPPHDAGCVTCPFSFHDELRIEIPWNIKGLSFTKAETSGTADWAFMFHHINGQACIDPIAEKIQGCYISQYQESILLALAVGDNPKSRNITLQETTQEDMCP